MDNLEMCRICASQISDSSATNLFERNRKSLLRQIKDLTGQMLKNDRHLPKCICPSCEDDLKGAHSFRKRCLESQSYFYSNKYKEELKRKSTDNNEDHDDEQEVVVIIKEENSRMDANENDILEIYTEKEKPLLNTSLKNESDYPPDPSIITTDTIEMELQGDDVSKSETAKKIIKTIKKPKRSVHNKMVREKLHPAKVKKSDEKFDLICDQCGNHFSCRHHFLTHLRRHTNDKPFKCEVCPDKFYTHTELKRHMRRHTGERPFACKHCQRRFTDYSTRIKHERTHTNERPYLCTQCGKAFTTSYVLKNHMLIHTGERSFKCSLCNKAFQRQTHLTVHFRSIMHKQMLEKQEYNRSLIQEPAPVDYINNENCDKSR